MAYEAIFTKVDSQRAHRPGYPPGKSPSVARIQIFELYPFCRRNIKL